MYVSVRVDTLDNNASYQFVLARIPVIQQCVMDMVTAQDLINVNVRQSLLDNNVNYQFVLARIPVMH